MTLVSFELRTPGNHHVIGSRSLSTIPRVGEMVCFGLPTGAEPVREVVEIIHFTTSRGQSVRISLKDQP